MITVKLSDAILDSSIGALDRTLGFLFGAARGFLIAAVAFLFFDKLVGEKQYPDWVRDAKLRPLLKESGDQLIAILPTDAGFLEKLKAKALSGQRLPRGNPVRMASPKRLERAFWSSDLHAFHLGC